MNFEGITTNIKTKDYIQNAIIPPPESFFGDQQSKHRIVIDSRLRDTTLFPNPNRYDIRLEDDITDAIHAQLIYLDLPSCVSNPFTIDSNFNTLYIYDGTSTVYPVVLDQGIYSTAADLQTEIQTKLTAAVPSPAITVAYVPKTDIFRFTSASPFGIRHLNRQNHIALLLGMDPNKDVNASIDPLSGLYTINAPYRWNPSYNDYIIMVIDDFGMLSSIDSQLNNSFALISRRNRYQQLHINDRPEYIKKFTPPIARLARLRVTFYDKFGNLVDFSNQDHRFELLIHCCNRKIRQIIK